MPLAIPVPPTLPRLTLASGVSYDPNSRLSSPFTEDSAGITTVLNGSWSSSNICTWPHIIWPLSPSRIPTAPFDPSGVWQGTAQLFERTAPGLTSDTSVCFGLINEALLTTGTVDGVFVGMRWASSTRNLRAGYVVNGATASVTDDASTSGNTRSLFAIFPRFGDATAGCCCAWGAFGFDSSAALITGDNVVYTSVLNPAFTHAFLAFGRTASTAGSATAKVDTFFSAAPGVRRAS